jgi:photosystem II stability/assembly factor-like uncharacterized protein
MNKFIFTILLLSTTTLFSQFIPYSGWSQIHPNPTGELISKVIVWDAQNVYASAWGGVFLKSSNGGINWSNSISSTFLNGLIPLRNTDMAFADPNTGYIVGYNNMSKAGLLKTTNSGINWVIPCDLSLYGIPYSIYFINAFTGWIGGLSYILKTTDGGVTWSNYVLDPFGDMLSVFFPDQNTGYAAGNPNRLWKSTNGGTNWNLLTIGFNIGTEEVYFFNANTGLLIGSLNGTATVLKSTNGGNTWVPKLTGNIGGKLYGLKFINESTGIAAGGWDLNDPATIVITTNGGDTWENINPMIGLKINSVGFSGSGLVIAGGDYGAVMRSTNSGLNWSFNPALARNYNSALYFMNNNTGWAADNNWNLFKTTNGGINWNVLPMGLSNVGIYQLQFFNLDTGYVRTGSLRKTINGGTYWYLCGLNNLSVNYFDFVNSETGWAGGYKNNPTKAVICKTTNGGLQWDTVLSINQDIFEEFQFINMQTGWFSLRSGKILKTTDGGSSTTQQHYDSVKQFKNFNMLNSQTGWFTSTGINKILKTTNGGTNWFPQFTDSIDIITDMDFNDVNTGWILAVKRNSPCVYKTVNGGSNWELQFNVGTTGLSALQFTDNYTGWAVGSGGAILKTTNGGEIVNVKLNTTKISQKPNLIQNYPNPFNPRTKIQFSIPGLSNQYHFKGMNVKFVIYNSLGQEVEMLLNRELNPGEYEVTWDGSQYPSGVYFYRLKAIDGEQVIFSKTMKMVLIK